MAVVLDRLRLLKSQPRINWLTPQLAVGAAFNDSMVGPLTRLGVDAVVDLRERTSHDPRNFERRGLGFLHLPITDREAPELSELRSLTGWMLSRIADGQAVLIHCQAGKGRSVTVGLATLMAMGYGLSEAYSIAQHVLGVVEVTDRQQETLLRLEAELMPEARPLATESQ